MIDTSNFDLKAYLKKQAEVVNRALEAYFPADASYIGNLGEVMRYSLFPGGKRFRPILTLAVAEALGLDPQLALPAACSFELVHCFSLVHDDLPCMDDDELRRGKPSNHIVYGEDTALLAGDALQSLAFEVICCEDSVNKAGAAACAKAAYTLAKYCGARGMVAGQAIDLEYEDKNAPIEVLRQMDIKKTGGLIKAACEMGCIAANADDNMINAAGLYGEYIGIAFQIVDDILDVTSSQEELGKPIGSDFSNQKSTYVSLLGIDKCRELVNELTKQAIDALSVFTGDTKPLVDFALKLANRKK